MFVVVVSAVWIASFLTAASIAATDGKRRLMWVYFVLAGAFVAALAVLFTIQFSADVEVEESSYEVSSVMETSVAGEYVWRVVSPELSAPVDVAVSGDVNVDMDVSGLILREVKETVSYVFPSWFIDSGAPVRISYEIVFP